MYIKTFGARSRVDRRDRNSLSLVRVLCSNPAEVLER